MPSLDVTPTNLTTVAVDSGYSAECYGCHLFTVSISDLLFSRGAITGFLNLTFTF